MCHITMILEIVNGVTLVTPLTIRKGVVAAGNCHALKFF